MLQTAHRLQHINEYYFSKKLREIEALNQQGKNIISLAIGSPDLPPHPDVIKVLQETAADPASHGYQGYKGIAPLRSAMANWYKTWYHVELDPAKEVLPLMGSKEGIMHICMTYLNPGDKVLVPDPGYPTYASNVTLAGAAVVPYTLKAENNWYPDFATMEKNGLDGVKLMFVNYPHMPTGQPASMDILEKLVAFAQQHRILLVHDNPYSFILNDNPVSLLSVPGAMDVAIELNSLSKSHNMAGWRVGMLLAKPERINDILRFKSNMDSGMFLPLQLAATKALSLAKDWHGSVNKIYEERRTKVYELLDILDCRYSKEQVGMFMWAKIPGTYKDCYEMADDILYNKNVFVTPGGIFGREGEQYIRVSLCGSIEKLEEAIRRIKGN